MTEAGAAPFDSFGFDVAVDGKVLVVGAQGFVPMGLHGSAVVFERDASETWTEIAVLTASDGAPGDLFGASVGVSEDVIVVGAHFHDVPADNAGAAYVFERDHGGPGQWGQVTKLTAPGASPSDVFGQGVDVDGDTIVVGGDQDAFGAVYVFERDVGGPDSWGFVTQFSPADADFGDQFGRDVQIDGDTVVGGARGDDDDGSSSGSATVFERDAGGADQWGQMTKLTASDAQVGDLFGMWVDVHGDTIVASSHNVDGVGTNSGAAYVFERDAGGPDAWGQVARLTASDAATFDTFGSSVAVDGNTVLVGAENEDDGGNGAGTTYLFRRDSGGVGAWGEVAKLLASDSQGSDNLGNACAIDGDTVVVGAHHEDHAGSSSGAVYVYSASGVPGGEVSRAGTPPNPVALLPGTSGPPVTGATWEPVLDHTTFVPNAVADLALVAGGPFNLVLGPEGTLLCDPASPLFLLVAAAGPGLPFALPIPGHCAWIGTTLSVQGVSIDVGLAPHLSNALDVVIGS